MRKLLLLLSNFWFFGSFGYAVEPRNIGTASYYGYECSGRLMANGKPFEPIALTCASWFYPLGTKLRITNITTGKSVLVEVTDRGPAKRLVARGRIVDLSLGAFSRIAPVPDGLCTVHVTKL